MEPNPAAPSPQPSAAHTPSITYHMCCGYLSGSMPSWRAWARTWLAMAGSGRVRPKPFAHPDTVDCPGHGTRAPGTLHKHAHATQHRQTDGYRSTLQRTPWSGGGELTKLEQHVVDAHTDKKWLWISRNAELCASCDACCMPCCAVQCWLELRVLSPAAPWVFPKWSASALVVPC